MRYFVHIYVVQGAAKLPGFGDTKKKIRNVNPGRPRVVQIRPSGRVFFRPPNLKLGSFAVSSATRVYSTSFESPETGANRLSFIKSPFRLFFSTQRTLMAIIHLVRVPFQTGIAVHVFRNVTMKKKNIDLTN